MPINYLASYQIGRVRPDKELKEQEFKILAKENKKSVPDITGIEVRINGRISKHGNVIDGPNPSQIQEICQFINAGNFRPAYYHLSNFGLDILLGENNGKKVGEDILATFDKFVGHYKEHESLFGQSMRDRDLALWSKSRIKPKQAFNKYVRAILNGSMPPNPRDELLVEHGYFARNSITEVYEYAKRYGLHTVIDTGHVIREILDPVPREGGIAVPESDLHKFMHSDGTFKTDYIAEISSLAEHLHFHCLKKEPDGKTGARRVIDHVEFSKENIRTFDSWEQSVIMGLFERLLSNAKVSTCTIELTKNLNTPKNLQTTMDALITTFGPKFNPC